MRNIIKFTLIETLAAIILALLMCHGQIGMAFIVFVLMALLLIVFATNKE